MKNKNNERAKRGGFGCSAVVRHSLNDEFRNGGDPVEDRDGGSRDLVGDMTLASRRTDVLANDLVRMGVIENGDDYPDDM